METKDNKFLTQNEEVRAKMDDFCKDDVTWLFHGTRPENIWSIEKNDLNPAVLKSGVHITGKAYGYGIYTAPYCMIPFFLA